MIDRVIKHLAILLTESVSAVVAGLDKVEEAERERERERKVVRVSIFITWFNLTAIARTGDWWRFYTRLRGDKGNDEKVVYPLEINMDTFLSPPFSQGFFKGQIILDVWSKSFRIFVVPNLPLNVIFVKEYTRNCRRDLFWIPIRNDTIGVLKFPLNSRNVISKQIIEISENFIYCNKFRRGKKYILTLRNTFINFLKITVSLLLTTPSPLRENGTQEREKKERNYVQSSKNSFEKKTATFLIHRVYTKRYVLDFFFLFFFFSPLANYFSSRYKNCIDRGTNLINEERDERNHATWISCFDRGSVV